LYNKAAGRQDKNHLKLEEGIQLKMGIQIEEASGTQVIRLISNPVAGSDITAVTSLIQERLAGGASVIVLSIEDVHKESFVACGLIAICAEMVQSSGGTLMLTTNSGNWDEALRKLCISLNILKYDKESTTLKEIREN
jgi:hypothetical protein